MRLIDADALLDEYCGDCNNVARQICGDDPICGTAMMVKDAPTVDDAVVVVRCKDCIHHEQITDSRGASLPYCHAFGRMHINDNGFCSYGERRNHK